MLKGIQYIGSIFKSAFTTPSKVKSRFVLLRVFSFCRKVVVNRKYAFHSSALFVSLIFIVRGR